MPDAIETAPIGAYRAWKLAVSSEGVPLLYSAVQDHVWLPYEATHGQPTEENHEGVYAWKSPQSAWDYAEPGSVTGIVKLWGTVFEYDEGYRAEFGYPAELWVPDGFDAALIVRLEETYGVPVSIKEFPATSLPQPPPPPMKFKPAGGIVAGLAEVIRDVIYDRQPFDSGRIHFFVFPLGSTRNDLWNGAYNVDWAHTNMVQAGVLPAPNRFVVTGMRCVFFERDGRTVPISDPIYWETWLRFSVNRKSYWMSPPAHCADPAILFGATDWAKIPAPERLTLINKLVHKMTATPMLIPGGNQIIGCDGVMIEQQQYFDAEISASNPHDVMLNGRWEGRQVMVTLEGIALRAVL